jgi:glutamate-ammonia-ligase adenylyltransferase
MPAKSRPVNSRSGQTGPGKSPGNGALFFSAPDSLPAIGDAERARAGLQHWDEQIAKLEDPAEIDFARSLAEDPLAGRLLKAIFANSPFLSQCILRDTVFFLQLLRDGPEKLLRDLIAGLQASEADDTDRRSLMQALRSARRRVALLIALADLTGTWPLEEVTGALTRFAATTLSVSLAHLLRQAAARNELVLPNPERPLEDCGVVILAMGKLGAGELNYSSDIDIIVLFDPARIDYRGRRTTQEALVRLTRDLVTLMEERTGDGYVFRVDLRLRPDPAAMPLALSIDAALTYYESMGQNWERAAMIKARPVAGDLALGEAFLRELEPFVWRKNLDFWALQDIHSIKRQIHAHKGGAEIALPGHNIKLGRGGIREIEFFAQTQQLIYGGRDPSLRNPRTTEALAALEKAGRINPGAAEKLTEAYGFLRRLEHRLQMIEDQQTHDLPVDEAGFATLAALMGEESDEQFCAQVLRQLRRVESYYAELFEEAPSLSAPGNLVFTGGEAEPATLETLEQLGFADGQRVFGLVRGWHHSRHRATRSTRARELLTELMPALLEALGGTPNPDAALVKFDEFLSGLPAGVQLFSLLHANPDLLDLLAEIMGTAPALADHLSRNPGLLDAVLSADFHARPPSRAAMDEELAGRLARARDFQDVLDLSRRWANDRKFQVGVQILRHTNTLAETGRALSDIADSVIAALTQPVLEEFAKTHGRLPGAELAILGLGKLGSGEMTVSSDLDLIFIYDCDEGLDASDGAKPLAPSHYFARLSQRLINALTAPTAEGRLYEIDMRLRPSGQSGPIATPLAGFRRYQEQDAWTWEHMALTRARVISGEPALASRIEAALHEILCRARDPDRLLVDVADMRRRIDREFTARSLWDVKYLRGGLVDLEFLAQYLQLRHAHDHPEALAGRPDLAFARLAEAGVLGSASAQQLIDAITLVRAVQGFLRVTAGAHFDEAEATEGLKASLARAAGCADFAALKDRLLATAQGVLEIYDDVIEAPAADARERLGDGAK